MANKYSMSFNIDGYPTKKQRNKEGSMSFYLDGSSSAGSDGDSSLSTLVSVDYVRVSEVVLPNDGNEGKQIEQIYETEEDRSETEDEDRKIIDEEDRKIIDDESSEEEEEEVEEEEEEERLIVYGTVIVEDCWGDDIVFHHYPYLLCEYSLPLPPRLPLQMSLGGPSRAISGDDKFIIKVSLWGLLRNQGIIKEIANGEIVWDPYKQDNKLSYNEPLQQHVSGKHGSVSVGYSVMQRALSATIDVVWTKEKKSQGQLYGTIKAVRLLQGSPTERILFHISEDKSYAKYVKSGESLFRSRFSGLETSPSPYVRRDTFPFPVQMRSRLTIEVDLRDHLSPDPDGQSVRGQVQFTTEFGTQTKYITGKYSEVKVSMTCELRCPEQ